MNKITNVITGLSFVIMLTVSQSSATEGVLQAPITTKVSFGKIDYANAIPMEKLVDATYFNSGSVSPDVPVYVGKPGFSKGGLGTGELLHESLGKLESVEKSVQQLDVQPQEYGLFDVPYSTSRVDMLGQRLSRKDPNRRAGKLFFLQGGVSYVCSASSIKPGIVVTAAHCLYDNTNDVWASDWEFIPAYYADATVGVKAPYGRYGTKTAYIPTAYIDPVHNVVNDYDVGILVMKMRTNPDTGTDMFPGTRTGYYGYGWDGYGFTNGLNDASAAQIHQLGYPVSHDGGHMMQKNDSQGKIVADYAGVSANPVLIGTRMTGGSSGGPYLINYGETAVLSGTAVGSDPNENVVIGTASFGSSDTTQKYQGASPFTSTNLIPLLDTACANYPLNCGL